MNSNNDSANSERKEHQQQFQKPGQRPGYDDDNSHHLRSDFSGEKHTHDDGVLAQDDLVDTMQETEHRWKEISQAYRRKYPNLTNEDVEYREGEFDNMTERIAKRTNRNRKEVQEEIRRWQSPSKNSN